jgi:hypothetical protein
MAESIIRCNTKAITVNYINSIDNHGGFYNIGNVIVSRGYISVTQTIPINTFIGTMSTNKPSFPQNLALVSSSGIVCGLYYTSYGKLQVAREVPAGYYIIV